MSNVKTLMIAGYFSTRNFLCEFADDVPVHNNGVEHGEDGTGDEAVEVAEIV